jgi:hypothetical protein
MEMATCCIDIMERTEKDKITCCPIDFLDIIRNAGLKTDLIQIRSILKDSWGIHSEKNGDYMFYHIGIEGELFPVKKKGRYLEIHRATIDKILL